MYDWAELRHFRYLLAIVEKNGFRAAADVLHTTQPNLSAQAKRTVAHELRHIADRIQSAGANGSAETTEVRSGIFQ